MIKHKWYNRLRWKLFLSHLLIGVISIGVLIVTTHILTGVGLNIFPISNQFFERFAATFQSNGNSNVYLQIMLRDALIVAAIAALEAAIIVSLSVSTRLVEPLQAMTAVSRKLAQGFYNERTVIRSQDELAELSRTINHLAASLEQTERRRMALLSDVTHELRTPLATIGGYMEGLIDGVVQPDRKTFELVLSESQRLQRLIEDLQLLSHAEAGQIPLKPTSVNLCNVMQKIRMQFWPQFDQADIDLLVFHAEELPPVWADPDRIEQVLINLLSNALRYTARGGRVSVQARLKEGQVLISIYDTGVGIAPEHLPHLFERFYRVDKSRSRASGGSGIGLTIARHLIYAQGGEMWAESAGLGRGTAFHFTLPYRLGDSTPLPCTCKSILTLRNINARIVT
ncbi:MAG: HAMP domain-containing protein [Chloroflexaceae bacterium]|nr:HAMP domain-containing protein [Chloroflexaceae bacterium]NJL32657.1 HAMP domain-containing protein [Chloroflexaceae bacterium]